MHTFVVRNSCDDVVEVKIVVKYTKMIDGDRCQKRVESEWCDARGDIIAFLNETIDNSVLQYYQAYVYIIMVDGMSHRHKFLAYFDNPSSIIKIVTGTASPIVTINGRNISRCDSTHVYSLNTLVCGCDVQRGLDSFEQAEYNMNDDCCIN